MSARTAALRRRIEALSPDARARLVLALRERAEARGAGPLVAYVAAAGDTDTASLRRFLGERLPDAMVPAAFVVLPDLPRTPAGKVDTRALPAPADPVRRAAAEPALRDDDVEATLATIWSELLGGVRIERDDNFFEIGGDSILSIQVVARAARAGLRLAPDDLFRHQTIADLARVAVPTAAPSAASARDTDERAVPLTPIQHWFFEQGLAQPSHWHHVVWLDAPADMDRRALREALRHVVDRHDALRLRFRVGDGGPAQARRGGVGRVTVEHLDVSAVRQPDLETALRTAVDAIAAATDLTSGATIAALVAERNATPFRIALVVHHLVVDPVSWGILVEDLNATYEAIASGGEPALEPRTTPFAAWADALVGYADEDGVRAGLEHWTRTLACPADVPRDLPGEFTEATAHVHVVALDTDRTRALVEDVPGVYGTQTDEVLLAALLGALNRWTGRSSLRVGVERHGREAIRPGLDLSRTVGWFTSYFPVALALDRPGDAGAALRSVKERMRAVPDRGIGYGVLRYLSPDPAVRERLCVREPDVIFNYGGRVIGGAGPGGAFTPRDLPAASRAPGNHRAHCLEVGAIVSGGRLEMHWTYSRAVHRETTIRSLADDCLRELDALIEHCLAPGSGGFTPSDFPEAGLSQEELDRLLGGLA